VTATLGEKFNYHKVSLHDMLLAMMEFYGIENLVGLITTASGQVDRGDREVVSVKFWGKLKDKDCEGWIDNVGKFLNNPRICNSLLLVINEPNIGLAEVKGGDEIRITCVGELEEIEINCFCRITRRDLNEDGKLMLVYVFKKHRTKSVENQEMVS